MEFSLNTFFLIFFYYFSNNFSDINSNFVFKSIFLIILLPQSTHLW